MKISMSATYVCSTWHCLTADVGPCDVNTCQNGGRCTRVSDTQRCDCREGYVGDRCGTGKDPLHTHAYKSFQHNVM